ncbi:quinone oxidoreductase family protein [Oceanobacter mangrovi]|uniref:quinone oxidoreductase family protein n=1 Tax=Oceanobacter mangrovi TaxID=2862510 RepID=UPI001C8DA6AA|nr:zinc-binding alcohol dehydrogenase family protein [Oceanobacter mangrovi]
MKAALVTDLNNPPVFGITDAPTPQADDLLVYPTASTISQLVRAKASGRHYSANLSLPFVPGVDGVGRLASGERVFFAFPPMGSMAEQTLVKRSQCVAVPDDLDDVTAAALGNPGMSSVAALQYRAGFKSGDNVLINGAAGASGRLAIQIARYLGAGKIIASARNAAEESSLLALGADEFICLAQPHEQLIARLKESMIQSGIDIVLDYLWGTPAAAILTAAANTAMTNALKFVNIGSLAGADIPLNASILRSKNLQLMGSGLGSVSNAALLYCIGQVLQMARPAGLQIATHTMPLEQVSEAWQYTGPERLVLTIGS